MSNQTFQILKDLPTPLFLSQCVLHRHELLIFGDTRNRDCYSYHILKNEYKFVCSYPSDVELDGHCVVKLDNNNKDSNEINLLSFGGFKKHTLIMKYVSVWSDGNNDNETNKSNKSKNHNKWIPFTNNKNRVYIGKSEDDFIGVRAVVGGSNNHFVFDLNTFQFIERAALPTNYDISCHCFVSKSENGQESNEEKESSIKKKIHEMLLFCYDTGLLIEYNEENKTFQFHPLPVCDDIASLNFYAYVYVNDAILFFGGLNISNNVISKSVHKYSIRENKWMTFQNTLPSLLKECIAILSEDNTYVHIIGGKNEKNQCVSMHMKTKVNEWPSEEEMKKENKLKIEEEKEEKKEEDKNNKIKKEKEEPCSKFEQLSSDDFENPRKNDLNNGNIHAITYVDHHPTDEVTEKSVEQKRKKTKNKNKEIGMRKRKKVNVSIYFVLSVFFIYPILNKTQKDIKMYETIDNQDNKEKELTAYVIVDERKMSIKMKELTFDELFCQICTCLEPKYLLKINNEPFKMQLVDMKNNTIESDEDVRKEFKNGDPLFKLLWVPKIEKIGKIKTIKNALVVMIAISEYCDNKMLCNLPNVREKDVKNFREVFKQELNYEFVCNEEFKMNKEDIDEFLENVIVNHKLYKNKRNYDALIIIIAGHGDEGDALVTSDGKHVPIDGIRSLFNCNKMESLRDYPKIFIIDVCRGSGNPQ
ncbi:hypothetical protein RFI_25954, partial [Reticulomyxa filosa]